MKALRFLPFSLCLGAALHAAPTTTTPESGPVPEHEESPPRLQYLKITPENAKPEDISELLRVGAEKLEQREASSAEVLFLQVINTKVAKRDQIREAFLGLARAYRLKSDFTKAAAVYEKLLKDFPDDPLRPTVYLELGRTLRALGSFKLAINRFYSVINTTLKLPEKGANYYRQLARTAQFEVAETYFQAGDYVQAHRFFSRLTLLDLAIEDRARAAFKAAHALSLSGEREKAIASLRIFIEANPDHENTPEARYLLAVQLRQAGRSQDALSAALELLRIEKSRTNTNSKLWAYWQRRTGNQLANEFYEQGDTAAALQIYLSIAALGEDPAWKLPVVYQIGLCHERLRQSEKARVCYQSIIDSVRPVDGKPAPSPELTDLAGMAAWRLENMHWQEVTDRQITTFFAVEPPPPPPPAPPPPSS